jgi:hypothetical protein
MNVYPKFYRNSCTCIRRESDTVGYIVEIPEPSKLTVVQNNRITMRDKSSFDAYVQKMEPATHEVYEKYTFIYHQFTSKQTQKSKAKVNSDFAKSSTQKHYSHLH